MVVDGEIVGGHCILLSSVSVVSEPGGGRGRSGQAMPDLVEAVTSQCRAVAAVASLLFDASVTHQLGGSAASLPVRGFM